MLQLTDTTLFHWDSIISPHESSFSSSYNAKKGFSGTNNMKNVQTWMSMVQSPRVPLLVGGTSSASSQSYVPTIPNTEFNASSPPGAKPISPMRTSSDGLQVRYRGFDSEANDDAYRDILANLPKHGQRVASGVCLLILCNVGCSHAISGYRRSSFQSWKLARFFK
jgi:hypothetical protein